LNHNDNIDESPCIRKCSLNEDDTCLGCFRSLEEILQWGGANNQERIIILQNARQRREAYTGKSNW
jgi:predicted Fe-S protein YdhL (DUF1289 family)